MKLAEMLKTEGLIEGLEKGRAEERRNLARKMLQGGLSLEAISQLSELPLPELKKLQQETVNNA